MIKLQLFWTGKNNLKKTTKKGKKNCNGLENNKNSAFDFRDEEEKSLGDFCSAVAGVNSQFSAVIDLTWNGWDDVETKCKVRSKIVVFYK